VSLTGGDWLRAEEKGKKAFHFRFDGMLAISSNFPIFAKDNSSGLTRRTISVPFNAKDNSSGLTRRTISVPFNASVAPSQRRDLNKDFQPQLTAFTNYLLSIPDERVTCDCASRERLWATVEVKVAIAMQLT
jgi:putative DNA primase/helicase